jgi:hypothetical protein
MKPVSIFCLLASGAFLSGCASERNGLVLDPVGPPPGQTFTTSSSTDGTLVVYSAYDPVANWTARNPRRPVYSNYKIFFPDGTLLRTVHNDSGTMLQDAVPVELPTGGYRVVASANGYGRVTLPVVIAANQTTVLHLEGGNSWPNEAEFNQTNAVRLPDGEVIGWRAVSAYPSKL